MHFDQPLDQTANIVYGELETILEIKNVVYNHWRIDTKQPERVLASDAYTRNVVRGVIPRDDLSMAAVASYPVASVCNTHASDREGQHGISMYLTKDGRGKYFDSYGLPPQHD